MKPVTINGERYFPQQEKLLSMLSPGDQFKTKNGAELYTISESGELVDSKGDPAYFPEKMPVVPMKKF